MVSYFYAGLSAEHEPHFQVQPLIEEPVTPLDVAEHILHHVHGDPDVRAHYYSYPNSPDVQLDILTEAVELYIAAAAERKALEKAHRIAATKPLPTRLVATVTPSAKQPGKQLRPNKA